MSAEGVMSVTAGWYADPQEGRLLRWWDGAAWTVHRQQRLVGPGAGQPDVTSAQHAATPTVLPPVAPLTPSSLPLSAAPDPALAVAARWAAAWVDHPQGVSAQQWVDGLRPFTTDEYLGVLVGVDPANIPASRVTGEPRATKVAARSVQVEVPTNTLTLDVLVVLTDDGWRVAGYDRV